MDDKQKKYLGWGLLTMLGLGASVFILPILAGIVWNLVSIAAGGCILVAMYFLAPAFAELLGTVAWRAKELVWKTDPIAKLWRDLNAFGQEIEELNSNIQDVATEEYEFEQNIKQNKDILGPERVLDWNDRLSEIRESKTYLIEQREELRIMYKESERDVKVNEVEWKLGNAYNKAANAVNKANGIAGGTQGGKVAMATIQHNLSEGRARLQTLRTMKSSAEIREIMKQRANQNVVEVKATVVPDRKSLTNNPSPVLQGLTSPAGSVPVTPRQVPKSLAESLVDKI